MTNGIFLNLSWAAYGTLTTGDYLIVDNASVHGGMDSIDLLLDFLEEHGVSLVYLPAYSPELNPCENVFCMLKTHLRQQHQKFQFGLMLFTVKS